MRCAWTGSGAEAPRQAWVACATRPPAHPPAGRPRSTSARSTSAPSHTLDAMASKQRRRHFLGAAACAALASRCSRLADSAQAGLFAHRPALIAVAVRRIARLMALPNVGLGSRFDARSVIQSRGAAFVNVSALRSLTSLNLDALSVERSRLAGLGRRLAPMPAIAWEPRLRLALEEAKLPSARQRLEPEFRPQCITLASVFAGCEHPHWRPRACEFGA